MVVFCSYFESPIGVLRVECTPTELLAVQFCDEVGIENPNWVTQNVILQLKEYFEGKRKTFDVAISLDGTDFQKEVWRALTAIPFGKTVTYKQIAEDTGKPSAARAVGNANNKNKIAIIIPCHRVVGASKASGGYAAGMAKKNWLLEHEKRILA